MQKLIKTDMQIHAAAYTQEYKPLNFNEAT